MNKLKIGTIVLSALFLFSCNNKTAQEVKEEVPTVATEVYEHVTDEPLQLNDGQKWKVDDNMMAHITAMEKDIASLDKPEDFDKLSENLNKNLGLLTSNCTMKGQAHDELHKWLLPYIDLVEAFSIDKSADNFTAIQNSFSTFNTYFQ
ncbi:hypothetical protein [Flavobacterium psychraquaticum]|uniref:hypothetical protein n=1 Tax=Flavobacterium psychraquaticum TaxID=3103958 RepID=UPI002ACD85D6|nr:hypothetical protein [Flavobacterium sp. LB-N7T]